MSIEYFLGVSSTGWTAIGSIITGLGIASAHLIPTFQKNKSRSKILKILIKEIMANKTQLARGLSFPEAPLISFRGVSCDDWNRYRPLAIDYIKTNVFLELNTYYSEVSGFVDSVENDLRRAGIVGDKLTKITIIHAQALYNKTSYVLEVLRKNKLNKIKEHTMGKTVEASSKSEGND